MATDLISYAAADNYRLARSKRLVAPADDTYYLIQLPQFTFVTAVWVLITTAYSLASATLTIGWIGNREATAQAAGFMSSDIAKPAETGLKKAMHDTLVAYPGKYFSDGSGLLTLTSNDNGGTAGTFIVFCEYSIIY